MSRFGGLRGYVDICMYGGIMRNLACPWMDIYSFIACSGYVL